MKKVGLVGIKCRKSTMEKFGDESAGIKTTGNKISRDKKFGTKIPRPKFLPTKCPVNRVEHLLLIIAFLMKYSFIASGEPLSAIGGAASLYVSARKKKK